MAVEEHYGGVRKEEAFRAYDAAMMQYHVEKEVTKNFLEKLNRKNVMSDNHVTPYHQTSDIGSSSRAGGGAVRSQAPSHTPRFRRSPAVNGASVAVPAAQGKYFLDPLIGIGVLFQDPADPSQKETLDFIGIGANGDDFWREVQVQIQPPAARAEPPLNLDLSLGQPGSM
ncbi:hypothetical protein HAX54_030622 [Datura stramonium]|uniref:Uncharacterized protein n=1 Tax=Datura stramonium TaxID=4076 RepID=A0ABS8SB52_DATST|nr:hypothetical protein [Datura stramonium]